MSTQIQIKPETGITIGTTPISNGANGRILFQWSGPVVQQDSNFVWDNTNKRLGVGISLPQSRLDVQAQGALSTDIAFRVRNSANTDNVISVQGDTSVYVLGSGDGGTIRFSRPTGHNALIQQRASNTLPSQLIINSFAQGGSVPQIVFDANSSGGHISFNIHRYSFGLSTLTGSSIQSSFGTTTSAGFFMSNSLGYNTNGTIPTTTPADHFIMYSADIAAGNAAPHFRTENGAVIKLYQQSSAGITTVADIVTVLQNLGFLS